MATFVDRIVSGWNAFKSEQTAERVPEHGMSVSYGGISPSATYFSSVATEKSILAPIYTQLAIDVASASIHHVKVDDNNAFEEVVTSGLNNCLSLEANIDQAATAFIMDIVLTLFEHGVAAIVPVDTTADPDQTGSYTIHTMRVGRIVGWYPRHVLVDLYNDRTGKRQEVYLAKTTVAIITNPLYWVMNEPNSTVKRLIRKLSLIDTVDEQSASGKLDIIIQLPYVIKTEQKREQAEQRRKDIEFQLKGSQYGIAYADGAEKITQLNRPAENNLMKQIEVLNAKLYSELGLTESIFNGTADEATILNYHNRTVNPILVAIVEELKRTFLTKTAVTQGHSVMFFRDPFIRAPLSELAEIADKMTRNEIMSSNEIRARLGLRPSKEKGADDLRNSNMPMKDTAAGVGQPPTEGQFEKLPTKAIEQQKGELQNGT